MNGLELSEIHVCSCEYSLHMQEHCKYCMQFSYFWTPVLVLRESSDLQLEVCNTLLRFKPLTLVVCCEVKYHES